MTQTRKLAAIMFTDIAGYTALMGRSEEKALEVVAVNQRVQRELVKEYGGTWHKDLGDGSLCSFDSTVQAVKCAIAIQQELNKQKEFKVRIGIHLGDVTFSNGDVYGDGVNMAARIQGEAAEGGICISEAVFKSTKGSEDIKSTYVGSRKLKNVKDPVKLYQIKAGGVGTKAKRRSSFSSRLFIPLMGLLILISGWAGWLAKTWWTDSPPIAMSIVSPTENDRLHSVIISPDGRFIGFFTENMITLEMSLFVRDLHDFNIKLINKGQGDHAVFSPDSKWIAFNSAEAKIKKYHLETGTILDVTSTGNNGINGIQWDRNGNIIFAPSGANTSILKVSAMGGFTDHYISEKEQGDLNHPFLIPGSKSTLFTISSSDEIGLFDHTTSKLNTLGVFGLGPKAFSGRYLTYIQEGKLVAHPWNFDKMAPSGDAVIIVNDIRNGPEQYDIAPNGTLTYLWSADDNQNELVIRERGGVEIPLGLYQDSDAIPRFSPDGKMILYDPIDDDAFWIYNIERGTRERQPETVGAWAPVWSHDGTKIYFSGCGPTNHYCISVAEVNSSVSEVLVTSEDSSSNIIPSSISADGDLLMYAGVGKIMGKMMIYDFSSKESKTIVDANHIPGTGQFSPDKNWLAYTSDITGNPEVYLVRYPLTSDKWLVSGKGGSDPRWSPDGRSLFYRSGNKMIQVPVEENGPVKDREEVLFDTPYATHLFGVTNYDINPADGSFLLIKPSGQDNSEIRVIMNWAEHFIGEME